MTLVFKDDHIWSLTSATFVGGSLRARASAAALVASYCNSLSSPVCSSSPSTTTAKPHTPCCFLSDFFTLPGRRRCLLSPDGRWS